jgi:antitoxin VapB
MEGEWMKMQTARLFQNGQSQAVRLPKEFRFDGDKVFIKRVGEAVVLLPYQATWQTLLDSLSMFSEDFMSQREQPGEQRRETLFP